MSIPDFHKWATDFVRANMREFSETSTSTIRFRARLEEELRRVYGEGLDARQARVAELEAAFVKVHALMIYDNAESLDEAYEIVSGITSGKPTASVSTAGTEVIDDECAQDCDAMGVPCPKRKDWAPKHPDPLP
jgi:hypothetical protein